MTTRKRKHHFGGGEFVEGEGGREGRLLVSFVVVAIARYESDRRAV